MTTIFLLFVDYSSSKFEIQLHQPRLPSLKSLSYIEYRSLVCDLRIRLLATEELRVILLRFVTLC